MKTKTRTIRIKKRDFLNYLAVEARHNRVFRAASGNGCPLAGFIRNVLGYKKAQVQVDAIKAFDSDGHATSVLKTKWMEKMVEFVDSRNHRVRASSVLKYLQGELPSRFIPSYLVTA